MPKDKDWFEEEHDALEALLASGEITAEDYQRQLVKLRREAARQEYKQDLRDAGRGHLI